VDAQQTYSNDLTATHWTFYGLEEKSVARRTFLTTVKPYLFSASLSPEQNGFY